jgi:hypothetical protein
MADNLNSVLVGAVAGILSAIVTYFSTRAKIHLDLAAEYDKQLQESRLEAYKQLWPMLEPLARYGRAQPVTPAVLRSISDQTRTWYFQAGGIYLTQRSRRPYFRWKAAMQPLLDDPELQARPEDPIPLTRLEAVIDAGSALRTRLSDDIGTKKLTRL